MKRWVVAGVGFLALAGLIGFISELPGSGGGGGGPQQAPAAASPVPHAAAQKGALAGVSVAVPAGGGAGGSFSAGSTGTVAGGTATAPSTGGVRAAELPSIGSNVDLIGPRIVKTASISLVIKRGDFGDAFREASMIAQHYAGFVESSSTRGTRSHTGRLVIRVPASAFDLALGDLRGLGRVEAQSVRGQDVTAEFVDLQARLRNWEAQETVLLRLMSRAATVEETLRVQRELQDVQLQIEELRGQLRVLNNQTSMSTIEISMREAGTPVHRERKESGGLTLGEAWDDAVDGFVGVLAAVVIGLGYLIPITVLALVLWLVYRRMRPRIPA